ncbi:unnamed protein product [Adineta ricciae]|uniref:protein-tyrosine-phosphatase n=1 Tax=Adineta ricciae TaxID=249248 RepID=A0A814ZBP2_ADIRI|nr:unnamed protein product [Adineta ricciae]
MLVVPLFFSIVSFTVRTPRTDQQANFYSVDILLNCTCSARREANLTLNFFSLYSNETNSCSSYSKQSTFITCDNFIYGVRYTIDGYLLCGTKIFTLSPSRELYEISKPKYINSTNSPTLINTLFFLPGLFDRLNIELHSVNQSCSLEYSSITSPFYHCSFRNLPSAQWFVLTYYILTENYQTRSADVTIVYTDLEELDFRCELQKNNQQVEFYWANLTGSGYSNLTISILTEENKHLSIILCDPYASANLCSTKSPQLEPGREYYIHAKLRKSLPNYNGQKIETCSIKTNLTQIPIHSLQHEIFNETNVRLSWSEHPFHVRVRLRNLETNSLLNPVENIHKMAIFLNLAEASVYQVEFNISKTHWTPLFQRTNYHIKTDFKRLVIENVIRLSDKTLIVHVDSHDLTKVELIYCIERVMNGTREICSFSNTFSQLSASTIYNISVTIDRDSFQNKFHWEKQTIFKLVNTNPPTLKIRAKRQDEHCSAEILNSFPISYSSECFSSSTGEIFDCNELLCGCRYQYRILFNQTYIDSLCARSPCDIQLNHPNVSTVKFQTPLDSIRNLRIVSVSLISREIQVSFDHPSGCFDQFVLICELISTKQREMFVNSTICTDLIPEAFYRISVEIKRLGWEVVTSQVIETQLIATPKNDQKKGSFVQSVLIPGMIGFVIILILVVLIAFAFAYRQRRRNRSLNRDQTQITTISHRTISTKLNNIVNQVNIYAKTHPDTKRNIYTSRPIRIKDLPEEYEQLIANNYYNISNEFHELHHSIQETLELAQCDQTLKNRYKDIIPYEHSRVKLIPIDDLDSGYINANFIAGLHNPREYIACQGPLKTTINDHWKMIWEQNVTIIVMLTDIVERGLNKCERYWPVNSDKDEMYGNLLVCVTNCIHANSYDLRYIQLKKDEDVRSIKHYAFKMWNDHTVPTNSEDLLDFIRLVRSEYRPDCDGPILVHCSAGVGRSGTFIALDRLLQQFDKVSCYGYLDIYGTVLDMRRCRDRMVQNEHQYLFIYRCLKDEYEKRSGNSNRAVIADDAV